MSGNEAVDYSKSFSRENVLAKAKWFHDDLQKGGWREVLNVENKISWIKTFPNEDIPTKVLLKFHLPLSAQEFIEVSDPKNMELRRKWDKTFLDNEALEEYPDGGGYVVYTRTVLPWPLADRDLIWFTTPGVEVEWYGKQAYLIPYINAEHKSKPASVGPYVRMTNGGQFVIVAADENDPNHACTLFALSHNLYNGYIPSRPMEWLLSRAVSKAFASFYDNLVEGHRLFFADKE